MYQYLNNIKNFFCSENGILTLYILLFIVSLIFSYIVYIILIEKNLFKTLFHAFNKTTIKKNDIRQQEQQRKEKLVGEINENSLYSKIDYILFQTGLKKKFKGLNADLFICIYVLINILAFLSLFIISKEFFITLSYILFLNFLLFVFIYLKIKINHSKVERNILLFVNLLENYSRITDDITTIMGKIYPTLDEPLCSAVKDCYYEGLYADNYTDALKNLANKIQHNKLKMILTNISVCSRFDNNYDEVIEDSRKMLIDYIQGQKKKQKIKKSARIKVVVILIVSLLCIYIMQKFFLNTNLIVLLTTSVIGWLIIFINCFIWLFCFIKFFLNSVI